MAVLISDGLSMAIGDYLSLKADIKQKRKFSKNNLVRDINPINNAITIIICFLWFYTNHCIFYDKWYTKVNS